MGVEVWSFFFFFFFFLTKFDHWVKIWRDRLIGGNYELEPVVQS